MHVEVTFIISADDQEDAEHKVESHVLDEQCARFWDGMEVQPHHSGTLEDMRAKLIEECEHSSTDTQAERYLTQAKDKHAEGACEWAGYYYRKAGLLLEQQLCSDTIVFNYETDDYSIPEETEGLYAIAVDFHY